MAPWRSSYAKVCKTLYAGAIPVGASRLLHKQKAWASGGIGIRDGLKIRWLNKSCGFKSHLAHQFAIKRPSFYSVFFVRAHPRRV